MKKYLPIFKTFFVLLLMGGAFFLGSAYSGSKLQNPTEIWPGFDNGLLGEVKTIIVDDYLDDVDWKLVFQGMMAGMVKGLGDPYSEYFSPVQAQMFWDDLNGNFEGIGVEIMIENEMVTVAAVLDGSPALASGVKAGDIVLAVDGTDVANLSLWQVSTMIKGAAGSKVKILLLRGEELLELEIIRDNIAADSVMVEQKDNILLVRISRFDEDSHLEIINKFSTINLTEIKGMIVDVRGNPGGYFESAVEISDLFLAEGMIVQERTKDKKVEEFKASAGDQLENMPVVILIDQGSASASEILAGAVQGNNRGKLVGQPSYGKGSVQVVADLSDGSLIKLTTAEWLTPDGTNLRLQGLKPDFVVELAAEGEDAQLQKAIELIKN